MRVLVCGDRKWSDIRPVRNRLLLLPRGTLIIEGGATGADRAAGLVANERGFPHACLKANWDFYGKSAGAIRNRWMLDLQPDLVIAFHPDLTQSTGTKDCVEEAQRRGIPVEVING